MCIRDSSEAEDSEARRKKRRRRRKKAAAVVVPELTAPPHKDFWEVWAAKYTFQDFEDGKFSPPNQVPEIEEEPPPPPVVERPAPRASQPRPAPQPQQPRSAPSSRPPLLAVSSPGAEADDAEFTKVCLNLGRSHGHKAATIRALLRDQLGLEGRSIRDLTVRDGDTLFRVFAGEVGRIQEALTGVREGTMPLTVRIAEDDERADLRAPPPADVAPLPAASEPGEPATISLDPLEFVDAPRIGDDAT